MNSNRSIKAYYKGKTKRRGQKTRPIDLERHDRVQVDLKPDWMKDMSAKVQVSLKDFGFNVKERIRDSKLCPEK
jgi:hypothetical protein